MTIHVLEPLVFGIEQRQPAIDAGAWIAPTATVIGSVTMQTGASIWYGAVIRADDEIITIGRNSNVQDGSVLHADAGFPCIVEDGVTVGHGVIAHGCTIGADSLIGMGSSILNGTRIGKGCLVAAGTLVPEGFESPDDVLILGVPAKVRRALTPEERELLGESAEEYVANARRHRLNLQRPGR